MSRKAIRPSISSSDSRLGNFPDKTLMFSHPGNFVPVAGSFGGVGGGGGIVDYTFGGGTRTASPHVAGIAALMLQKNPGLTAAQIEQILENTALPLPPGCRNIRV